jgi:hypothetical protein
MRPSVFAQLPSHRTPERIGWEGPILARVNRIGSVGVSRTLGAFIEQSYFSTRNWRLTVPTGNELHIERSTVSGYEDIWSVHVEKSLIAKIQLRNFDLPPNTSANQKLSVWRTRGRFKTVCSTELTPLMESKSVESESVRQHT